METGLNSTGNTTLKKKLYHFPLEPYQARYTGQLLDWEREEFSRTFEVETAVTNNPAASQLNGEVLDVIRRPLTGLGQVGTFLSNHPGLTDPEPPLLWFSDFYTTGLDALAYARLPVKAYAFLWAQTFDCYDFTVKHHQNWMPYWEAMAFSIYSKVFVASQALAELIWARSPAFAEKVVVSGLPFNSASCKALLTQGGVSLPSAPQYDVVWSSRLDSEKNPYFFIQLAQACPRLRFAILSGKPPGTGTCSTTRDWLSKNSLPNLVYHSNLTKLEYYRLLASSSVQFNASYQDWVSFTLLEALTFGCAPVYPKFRSFIEEDFPEDCYYRPRNLDSAIAALNRIIVNPTAYASGAMPILHKHDKTLNIIAGEIQYDTK